MKWQWLRLETGLVLVLVLLVTGCTSAPRKALAPPATKPAATRLMPPPPAAPVAAAPALRAGQLAVRIESRPTGALIVVGEQVLGHAPVTAIVQATPQGFFPANLTVRARFLATDAQHESVSVTQEFTHLDKVPAGLVLTPEGVRRMAR